MQCLDLTLAAPEQNLACDEALLDWCEAGYDREILRFWEPAQYFVVLGYTNKLATEVNSSACETRQIPMLRRCSGGGTVLQGPGCLNYSLLLKISDDGPLRGITETNSFIMERHAAALTSLLSTPVARQGHTDLTIAGLKFSGNAQRRRRRFLLFHGTFLLHFDLPLVSEVLAQPSKQPDYRRNRSHDQFLTNLNVPAQEVKDSLQQAWSARDVLEDIPRDLIDQLVTQKYSQDDWNFKF
jgi:lipoate-protein ligase A